MSRCLSWCVASLTVLALTVPAQAAWVQIDNFESGFGAPGSAIGGSNGWTTAGTDAVRTVELDPAGGSNIVLKYINGDSGTNNAVKSVSSGQGIAEGATGTMFFRFYMDTAASIAFGMTSSAATPGASENAAALVLGNPTSASNNLNGYTAASTAVVMGTVEQDTWYSLWVVVTNTTGGGTGNPDVVKFWLQGGSGAFATQQQLAAAGPISSFTSRTNYAAELVKIGLRSNGANGNTGTIFYDDFYINRDTQDLSNPVPEPCSIVLAGITALGVGLIRTRRKK